MDLNLGSIIPLAISIFSFFISLYALYRSRNSEIFSLRQRVLIESQKAKSSWYYLRRENDSVLHKTAVDSSIPPQLKTLISEFLQEHGEFIENSIKDACALADDVYKNIEKFNQKKCYRYLRFLEPGAEILARNQGESKRRVNEMIEAYQAKVSESGSVQTT
ncbi:MAG: hypothetical protein ABN482_16255 [Corticimicrobacter sp.]|uniref:hypothetical protein n=1 Tax=Corticimicrobacter sp. TaxID=2678536 RepID=UPI0032DB638F